MQKFDPKMEGYVQLRYGKQLPLPELWRRMSD